MGGQVPVPDNKYDNNDMLNGFQSLSNEIEFAILGLWDVTTEGKFMSFNGDMLNYTNWESGEPNNFAKGEDYVILQIKKNGTWNDISKDWAAHLVCQKDCSKGNFSLSKSPSSYFLDCELGWKKFKIGTFDSCLKFIKKDKIEKAVSICKSEQAKVPLPKSKEEDIDLYSALGKLGFKTAALDANDVNVESQWVDSSNNPLVYKNFHSSQPNNKLSKGGQDYLHYWKHYTGQWNDISGTYLENIVCQKLPTGKFCYSIIRKYNRNLKVRLIQRKIPQ